MISFVNFYDCTLLVENIDSVPRNVLGMSTSVIDLPDKEPYGFWVDRSGNFLEVGTQLHWKGLSDIVDRAEKHLGTSSSVKPKFSDLLNIGWMRVALDPKVVHYQLEKGREPTTSQRRFLETLQDLYDKERIVRDHGFL